VEDDAHPGPFLCDPHQTPAGAAQLYFFLFLLYAWMGSFYGLVMMSYPFMELFIYKVLLRSRLFRVGSQREGAIGD
jgi:hypothetical protein